MSPVWEESFQFTSSLAEIHDKPVVMELFDEVPALVRARFRAGVSARVRARVRVASQS